ncbi:MAG: ABC transporter substrate-binding protein [Erysipelotrichaceae bacterium]|nr:ABC transporter substrate-binding protein [Erysipelotrichaceae bacterium]
MKKRLLVLLSMLLVLCMAGCQGSTDPGNTEENDVYRIGIIQFAPHSALDAATQGFTDVVLAEFPDAVIDLQNAAGEIATCAPIVNGFVNDGVDLIMANATPAVQAAANATGDIPILGTSVTDYGAGLEIANFNGVTGMNVSGTSDLAPLDQQAQMILDLFPETKTVGILFCSNEANSKYQVQVVKETLEAKGITVIEGAFTDSNDIAMVVENLCDQCDALYIPTDNTAATCSETIANVVLDRKVPVIAGEEGICKLCGVATLTIDYYKLGRVTGEMAIKVLKGEADVATMPIEYFPDPVKKFNPSVCELFDLTVPEDFEAMTD